MNNYDHEIEKRAHPENFQTDSYDEAEDLLDLLSAAIDELDRYSVYHDDMFNSEVFEMEELVKRCRKQL